jgi:hypothetical protein
MPGAVGPWLPTSPQAHELGMLGGAGLHVPSAQPGGVGLGKNAGGGQLYDTARDDEDDEDDDGWALDEEDAALEDDRTDDDELLEGSAEAELLDELDELGLLEALGEAEEEGACELEEDDRDELDDDEELVCPPIVDVPKRRPARCY